VCQGLHMFDRWNPSQCVYEIKFHPYIFFSIYFLFSILLSHGFFRTKKITFGWINEKVYLWWYWYNNESCILSYIQFWKKRGGNESCLKTIDHNNWPVRIQIIRMRSAFIMWLVRRCSCCHDSLATLVVFSSAAVMTAHVLLVEGVGFGANVY